MRTLQNLETKKSGILTVSYKMFFILSMAYLVVPVVVFFFGWLKLHYAIIAALLLGGAFFLSSRDSINDYKGNKLSEITMDIPVAFILVLIVLSLLLTVTFDIGEFVWGTTDHAFRRAIYRDLVDKSWPVVYDLTKQTNPVVNNFLPDVNVGFSYYFAFWMIPALIGKIFGFFIGNISLVLWSALGIFLTMLGMALFIKRASYAVVFSYVFFSGLDIIPYLYFQSVGTKEWMWLEGYTQHIVYISNINDLLNVFNQCIPCWLIVILLMLSRNNRSVGLIGALTFAYSPWATIGMVPIAVYMLFKKDYEGCNNKLLLKNVFSLTNIVPAVVMLLIFAPFYMANSNATSISGSTLSFYGSVPAFLGGYLFTILVELVPIGILLFKDYRKSILFWVTMGTLLVMPFYKISGQNDLTMRGSMPEFFVLTVMLASVISNYIFKNKNSKAPRTSVQSLTMIGAVILLIAMSMVALQMLLIVVTSTFDGSERHNEDIYSLEDIRDEEYLDLIDEQFFVYDYEDTFFFKYLARK